MKNILSKILQHTRCPKGRVGRWLLWGMNKGHAPFAKWALTQMTWHPDWTILDIGCGGGANIAAMLELSANSKVYGIDVSEESVKMSARYNQKWLDKRCFIRQEAIEQLSFDKETFDLVTAFETIYFWKDLPNAFQAIYRVLRNNGFFMICVEGCDPNNKFWTKHIEGMTIYSPETLTDYLTSAGFTIYSAERKGKESLCLIAQKKVKSEWCGV